MTQRQIHNLAISEVWTLLRSRSEGLRPDEESDEDQYVQRPPLGWLVSQCREMRLDPVCVCTHRQASRGSFPKSTLRVGGQFYIAAVA